MIPQAFHRCGSGLNHLNLTSCIAVDDDTLEGILRSCPHLASITLSGCRRLTDTCAAHLLQLGHSIRHLDLGGCYCIGEFGLKALLSSSPSEVEASLPACRQAQAWDCVEHWAA